MTTFFWLCGLLSLPFLSPAQIQCPGSALPPSPLPLLTGPCEPVHSQHSTRQMVSALPFLCQHPGESRRAAEDMILEHDELLRRDCKRVRQVTVDYGAALPHIALLGLSSASKIPILYSFLIKPVQQKSWLLYTVALIFYFSHSFAFLKPFFLFLLNWV